MTTQAAVLVAALWSVTFGYEPSPDAEVGYDYIVQVETETLAALERGDLPAIEANLPEEVSPVRRIRVVVGDGELPRKLRPPVRQAMARTAQRPDIDAAASSTLLAQTGPAGGFGRAATGFSNGPATPPPTAATSTTPATTVPPPQYRAFDYATPATTSATTNNAATSGLDGSLQRITQPVENARDVLRETANNLGHAGQQAIDNTRQLMSDVVAPPTNDRYNPQASPITNLADRLQGEVRNTADAVRDSWDRVGATASGIPAVAQPAATTTQQRPFDNWASTTPSSQPATQPVVNSPSYPAYENDRYAQDKSVLAGAAGSQPATSSSAPVLDPPAAPAGTTTTQPTREVIDLENWAQRANNQASGNTGTVSGDLNRGFEAAATQPSSTGYPISGDSWRDKPQTSPISSWPTTVASSPPATSTSLGVPDTAIPTSAVSSQPSQTEVPPFGPSGNLQNPPPQQSTAETAAPPALGWYLLAWAIAAGSVGANLFQWGSIIDLRNKYRVALRRNSPGFGRSMAA